MKQIILTILICISTNLFSQTIKENLPLEKRNSFTIGILQGGGSLIGADIEFLLTNKLGFQLGAGIVGFGGGINYHIKPSIRSSFFSLQYLNQGIGNSFVQSLISPSFVYRSKKWFTAQLGLGVPLNYGPAYPLNMEKPSMILTYSIGAYIPF